MAETLRPRERQQGLQRRIICLRAKIRKNTRKTNEKSLPNGEDQQKDENQRRRKHSIPTMGRYSKSNSLDVIHSFSFQEDR